MPPRVLWCGVRFNRRSDRFHERHLTTDDRQRDRSGVEVDGEFRSGVRPQCKVTITGKDHESYFFALGNDLIIRLQVKRQIIKLPRHERFTFRQ